MPETRTRDGSGQERVGRVFVGRAGSPCPRTLSSAPSADTKGDPLAIVPPTDAELDTLIKARLALIGIDLSQLPATTSDPVTGAPSQSSVLASLRSFLRGTVPPISNWLPAPGVTGPDANRVVQQSAPPAEYPSILKAWTGQVTD